MKVEFSIDSSPETWGKPASRRIGRTKSKIIDMALALNKEVILIKKADGTIYASTDLVKGKIVKIN